MYHYTVVISNPPFALNRHFTFTDVHASNEFADWLAAKGIDFTMRYEPNAILTRAIAAVDQELALAAQGRVQ